MLQQRLSEEVQIVSKGGQEPPLEPLINSISISHSIYSFPALWETRLFVKCSLNLWRFQVKLDTIRKAHKF